MKLFFMVTLLALITAPGACFAGNTEILSIQPPPSALAPAHKLDGIGTIDAVSDGTITIDDCQYSLSPDIEYHSRRGTRAFPEDFPVGTRTGFILKEKKVIKSLWGIAK